MISISGFHVHGLSINEIHDNSNIVPETATHFLSRFHRIKRVIYWLAVDNYVIANYKPKNQYILKMIWDLYLILVVHMFIFSSNKDILHFMLSILNNEVIMHKRRAFILLNEIFVPYPLK